MMSRKHRSTSASDTFFLGDAGGEEAATAAVGKSEGAGAGDTSVGGKDTSTSTVL
jgi:hypothetical protein